MTAAASSAVSEAMILIVSALRGIGTCFVDFKLLGVRLLDWLMAPALISYIIKVVIPWADSLRLREDPQQLRLPSGVRP